MHDNFFQAVYEALMMSSPDDKCRATAQLAKHNTSNQFKPFAIKRIDTPGRPDKPSLVRFQNVPKRGDKEQGLIHTIHAIAHIEFNAINLALDALYRFQDMPSDYYKDWLKVAAEEATHFLMVRDYLRELNYDYGDFDAHNGLWEMCVKTDDDVLVRMALVPRVLEARGLDVTPAIQKKFRHSRFDKMVDILQVIFNDEITHVAIGSKWFAYCCAQRQLNADETFSRLISEHMGGRLRPPFNLEAREKAGFSAAELACLNHGAKKGCQ